MDVICPTCRCMIDTDARCSEVRGLVSCVEYQGHDGWHWSDLGSGVVLRWTGLYVTRSCPGRLSLVTWCKKDPGHESLHNHNGVSWKDDDDASESV